MNTDDKRRKASELLFEEYLHDYGYSAWQYEPQVPGKKKRLDYRLEHSSGVHFFEVKEFDGPPPLESVGSFDPYGPIRQKIGEAARQFKEYKEYPCSLVLANPKGAFVQLGYPHALLGAMLGNIGFTVPVGPNAKERGPGKTVFLRGGRMIDRSGRHPRHTTFSSVIVCSTFPLRDKMVRVAVKKRQVELGRELTLEENLALYDDIAESPELRRVRVWVYENPYARIPHARDLFTGPFDQRWGHDGGFIKRVYVGSEVARFEALLGET